MKALISLLLIILVTSVSWSSCAKNKAINVTAMYSLSGTVMSSSSLVPMLTAFKTSDNLPFSQAKVVSEHNRFFELSIIFNENLQQMISFFTHISDDKSAAVDNKFPTFSGEQAPVNACS